jgi:DNA-binding LytR/AlgR family response regulator
MPGMNGLELARLVRGRRPGLPILFATGYADAAVLAAEAGRGRVLKKPYRAADLAQKIREAIRSGDH